MNHFYCAQCKTKAVRDGVYEEEAPPKPSRTYSSLEEFLTEEQLDTVREAAIRYGLAGMSPRHLGFCGYGLLKWKVGWHVLESLEPANFLMHSIFKNVEKDEHELTEMQQWLQLIGVTREELVPRLLDIKPPESHREKVRYTVASIRRNLAEHFPEMSEKERANFVLDYCIKGLEMAQDKRM